MSNHARFEEPVSRLAIRPTIGAAIGSMLVLLVIAAAFLVAAVYPTLNGRVIAVVTVMVLGAIAAAVAVAIAVLIRLRLPSNNDAWVFW